MTVLYTLYSFILIGQHGYSQYARFLDFTGRDHFLISSTHYSLATLTSDSDLSARISIDHSRKACCVL